MMKKIIFALAALAIVAWGCSSDDGDASDISKGKDARPAWLEQVPNYDLYEQTMSVEVLPQDKLAKYVSDQDLLCATIGDEVRGVATPLQVDDSWLFKMVVGSNEMGVPVTLSYYCDKLHRIFTTQWTTFDASVAPTGTGGIYQPSFVK